MSQLLVIAYADALTLDAIGNNRVWTTLKAKSMSALQPAVIFDGDDTLWQTQALYEEAKYRFFEAMGRLGFNPQSVRDTLAQIDVANVATLGFSRHRFPTSMTEVYKYFCLLHGQSMDAMIIDQVREIGYSVFRRTPIVMDGALETLRILKHHYCLCLCTAGDIDVQQ